MSGSGHWLAVDYGEKTIGLAVAHPLTGSARPLPPMQNIDRTHLAGPVQKLLTEWRPERVIIGLPLDGEGGETRMSGKVREFADWLSALMPGTEISFQDERLTSEAAAREFALRRGQGRARRRDSARLDSMAAALILEAWMTEHGII
jgi:putative holliday junction resolvase